MTDKRRQELHCHACRRYVQFEIDISLDGNHVLKCPNCGHEHCRVVRNGVITEGRWDQRNGVPIASGMPVYYIQTAFSTTNSVYDNLGTAAGGAGSMFIANSWANTSSATTGSSAYFGTVRVT